MRLEDIQKVLEVSGIHHFQPLEFPSDVESCSVIDNSGGTEESGGVFETHLKILTREAHPSNAINKSHEIKQYLFDNLKGAFFNGKKILLIKTNTPEPLYVGRENGLYTVSFNYRILEG